MRRTRNINKNKNSIILNQKNKEKGIKCLVSTNNLIMELLEGSLVVVVITTLKVEEVSLAVELWEALEELDNLFLEAKVTPSAASETITIIIKVHRRVEL